MQRILVVDDSATIRRVVGRTLSQAGYEVSFAVDGRDALEAAQREVPDLVLVDFVMPHMNGFQFVMAMRGIANLETIPVVLMSAKADKIGDGFLAQTGALDAISKPFSPDAILTVTEHAFTRWSESERGRDTLPPGTLGDGDRASSIPPLDATPEAPPPETAPLILDEARAAICMRLAELFADADPMLEPMLVASALGERFDAQAMFERVEELATLIPGHDGEVAFQGRMEHIGLGEVLQLITHQRQTGILEIEKLPSTTGRAVSLCLEGGNVQLALGRAQEQEFRLGRYLLREDLIEREDLERILSKGGRRGLLGTQLVKLGYISNEELRKVLVQQTSELVYEAIRWRRGRFRFVRFASRPEAKDASLDLPIGSILMEGLRRVDEWRLIEEQIHSFDAVPRRDDEALRTVDLDRFSAEERFVLDTIDGERSIRAITEHTKLSGFDAAKILFQMATSRLIRL